MDKNYLLQIKKIGNKNDIARAGCLNNNGALGWLNVPFNYKWSQKFGNQEFFVNMSLILGSRISNYDYYWCAGCGRKADPYGYHALHCTGKSGCNLFDRHDAICDLIMKYLKRAGYPYKAEARWDDKTGHRLLERPGDIKILNFTMDNLDAMDCYFDVTIANIFAGKHINRAQKRAEVAEWSQNQKLSKYRFDDNIFGLGYEVLGGMSSNFKSLIREIAMTMEVRTQVKASIWVSRMRTQLNALLMKNNAKMILGSGIIQSVNVDNFIENFD